MKEYVTKIEWMNGTRQVFVFDSEDKQTAHTGELWDSGKMDKVEWIDYDITQDED